MGPQGRDRFDDVLEGALKRYGDVQPRAGIEGRVLANLAAREQRRLIRWRWMWAASGAAALAVALAVWLSHSPGGQAPHQAAVQEEEAILAAPVPAPKAVLPGSGEARHVRRTRRPLRVAVEAEAKLPRFPSPRPIGEQELMLLEYVQHYPGEAILIAQQQDAFQAAVEQAAREIRENSNQQGR